MAEDFTYINYSVEDIERYLRGRMTAKEMHTLERAALQDPFLADAIEGYRHEPFTKTYQHLQEISTAVLGEKQPAKIVALPVKANYWRAAAVAVGVVVIAGAALWYLQGNNGKNGQGIAALSPAEQKVQAAPDSAKVKAGALNVAGNAQKANTVARKEEKAIKEYRGDSTETVKLDFVAAPTPPPTNLAKAGAAKAVDSVESSRADLALKGRSAGLAVQTGGKDADRRVALPVDTSAVKWGTSVERIIVDGKRFYGDNVVAANNGFNSPPPALYKASPHAFGYSSNSNQAKFEGVVVDDNKKPLSNALVYTGKGKQMAVTDSNGHFLFNAADTQLVVQVSSAGYEPMQAQLKNNKRNYITVAQSASSLSAVEVVAIGVGRKMARKLPVDSLFPQGGWQSFREYVYKRLHKENEMDTTGDNIIINGSVEIEFTVDENGLAKDLKITKSLNQKIDAKALEVVQQWPGWIAGRKDRKARVVIEY